VHGHSASILGGKPVGLSKSIVLPNQVVLKIY
jgi:hypothetical protein